MGVCFMKRIISHNLPVTNRKLTGKQSIEERAISLAHYIIDSKDTVRGTAAKFGISKSTVHTEVTLKNGKENGHVGAISNRPIPESIEIKGIFLSERNPVVRLGLVIK